MLPSFAVTFHLRTLVLYFASSVKSDILNYCIGWSESLVTSTLDNFLFQPDLSGISKERVSHECCQNTHHLKDAVRRDFKTISKGV